MSQMGASSSVDLRPEEVAELQDITACASQRLGRQSPGRFALIATGVAALVVASSCIIISRLWSSPSRGYEGPRRLSGTASLPLHDDRRSRTSWDVASTIQVRRRRRYTDLTVTPQKDVIASNGDEPNETERTVVPSGSWRAWHRVSQPLESYTAHGATEGGLSHAQDGICGEPGKEVEWEPDTWKDANATFRWLLCQRCLPSFVGTECPPGDSFAWSPPPSQWTLMLPEKYGVDRPESLPAARGLFRHLAGTGCASWRRGVFLPCTRLRTIPAALEYLAVHAPYSRFLLNALPPLPPLHPVSGSGLPLCDTTNLSAISRGHVNPQTRLWVPEGCRLPYRWPHELVTRCTAGKRVLLVGDSPVRQWGHRLAAFMRGQPITLEHEYSIFATYAFDGARDEWRTLGQFLNGQGFSNASEHEQLHSDLTGLRRGVDLPDGPFYMLRMSDTKLQYWPLVHRVMQLFQPTHLVLGSNYWMNKAESVDAPERIGRELLALLRQGGAATSSLQAVHWFTFPCHPRPPHATSGAASPSHARHTATAGAERVPFKHHEERDARIIASLQRLWAAHSYPGGAAAGIGLHWMPTCALARAGVSSFAVDRVHLACRWHPFPNKSGFALPVNQSKATADLDCADATGATLSRFFLTSLCPQLL